MRVSVLPYVIFFLRKAFCASGHFASTVCTLCSQDVADPFCPGCFFTIFLKIFIVSSSSFKNLRHSQSVCSLLKKWGNLRDRMAPFFVIIKRDHHYGTVCTLLQKWSNGCCVRPLFYMLLTRGRTIAQNIRFFKVSKRCKSEPLFLEACKKRGLTQQPFDHFCKSVETVP